jgi:superkiller protein 3
MPFTLHHTLAAKLSLLGIAAALGMALPLTGCQSANQDPHRQAAINTYVQAVLLYQQGNDDQAIAALQQAVKEHHDLVMPHALLGDIYQTKKNYAAAVVEFEQVVRLDPYSCQNHYKLGLVYQLLNRLEDAVSSYLEALQLNPHDFSSNMNLGAVFLSLDKPDAALKYAQKAVQIDTKSAHAYYNLGVAYTKLEMYKPAEMAYRAALELDCNSTQTAFDLADNLMRQRRYSDAQSVMRQVVLRDDSPQAHMRFGDVLFKSRKYEEAVEQFENALKLDPGYIAALNYEGWALITQYTQGLGLDDPKRAGAIELWKRSLQINPNQPKITALVKQYGQKYAD